MHRADVLISLLKDRPPGTGAEIGVRTGETSARLLAALPGLERLWCVDPWEAYPEYARSEAKPGGTHEFLAQAYESFHTAMARHWRRVWVLRLKSQKAASVVPTGLDFVFIDGCHAAKWVAQDIRIWSALVKPGGLVAGHDYSIAGVRKAVDALSVKVEHGDDDTWWFWKAK